MPICPVTYDTIPQGQRYSAAGVRRLSTRLTTLEDFAHTAEQQRQEAVRRAGKISVQGVQPKLSVRVSEPKRTFVIVDTRGHYILKPQSSRYPELPENEDLSMRLAAAAGIRVPVHGLVYCIDGTLSYFIRRFDRPGRSRKVHVEDFAQLTGRSRDTKYDSSMEQVAAAIDAHCTFPLPGREELLRRTLFCLLTGNEDMHLKNFTVVRGQDVVELSPAYDMVNTTLALEGASGEELALPLRGKKNHLSRSDVLEYFAVQRLELTAAVVAQVVDTFQGALPQWETLIQRSFLSERSKVAYRELVHNRAARFVL